MADVDIRAGFPSPAQDYLEGGIDLNVELVKNPSSTFFGRVSGDSMTGAGIDDGDMIVIDKSLQLSEGDIAVCFLDGEFTLKRIHIEAGCGGGKGGSFGEDVIWLLSENPKHKKIKITQNQNFIIWGVVTYSIKGIHKRNNR